MDAKRHDKEDEQHPKCGHKSMDATMHHHPDIPAWQNRDKLAWQKRPVFQGEKCSKTVLQTDLFDRKETRGI